jgi:hypothetical protein
MVLVVRVQPIDDQVRPEAVHRERPGTARHQPPVEILQRRAPDHKQRIAVGKAGVRARIAGKLRIAQPPHVWVEARQADLLPRNADSQSAAAAPWSIARTVSRQTTTSSACTDCVTDLEHLHSRRRQRQGRRRQTGLDQGHPGHSRWVNRAGSAPASTTIHSRSC